jgi:hypothetical protein
LNAFQWGPDGWLYGCHGVFTHIESRQARRPGRKAKSGSTPASGGTNPTRREFEIFCEGTSNPGESISTIGARVPDRVRESRTSTTPSRARGTSGRRASTFNPFTYDDVKTIADHRHWVGGNPHGGNNRSDAAGGGHAHCGAMIYLGGTWPGSYSQRDFHAQRALASA